jgi:hypothetical protein
MEDTSAPISGTSNFAALTGERMLQLMQPRDHKRGGSDEMTSFPGIARALGAFGFGHLILMILLTDLMILSLLFCVSGTKAAERPGHSSEDLTAAVA